MEMSEPAQTEIPKRLFANPEGSNAKQKEIARLRNVSLDEQESPTERLVAAAKLLSRFGPTKRNVVVINSVLKTFASHSDYEISERARKIKAKLLKAKGLKKVTDVELPDPEEITSSADPTPEIVAGVSASEVPKALSMSMTEVVAAHHEVLGGYKWRMFNEGAVDLSEEERLQLLETILGCAPNVENVRSLFGAVHEPNGLGWTIAGSCPSIVRVAGDFLQRNGIVVSPPRLDEQTQSVLDRLNHRDFGVTQ
jgi:hypothetical protein